MSRSVLCALVSLTSTSASAGPVLRSDSGRGGFDTETRTLGCINFDVGALQVRIGDTSQEECTSNASQIVCPLACTPAQSGAAWKVSVSAGSSPIASDEIGVYLPTAKRVPQHNEGDLVGCYPDVASTRGVGVCTVGRRSCVDRVWGSLQ